MRSIAVEGLRNIRDLGGLRAGASRVRSGVLFRSEAPVKLGPAGLAAVRSIGIRTVVDLRDEAECDVEPTVIPPEIIRLHFPVTTLLDDDQPILDRLRAGHVSAYSAADLGQWYVRILEEHSGAFGKVIGVLADPGHWPTLVHCVAGKDRTGLACALLLSAAGVDEDDILDDYVLSTEARAHRLDELEPELTALGVDTAAVESLFIAPRQALEVAFEHLHRRYGSPEAYLRTRAWVSADVLRRLQKHLLASDGRN